MRPQACMFNINFAIFGSPMHPYKTVCASVRRSVHPSVGLLAHHAFVKPQQAHPDLAEQPLLRIAWLANHFFVFYIHFLDASSHLYKRVCPSIRPSVGRSVRHPFFSKVKNKRKWVGKVVNHAGGRIVVPAGTCLYKGQVYKNRSLKLSKILRTK